ncbi:Uncharacterised protein [Vibrio cholerae]|uniref:Uncharacterized protein n=1 Tax=Vibrio cholerae TaxID=666 RepID=A0A655WIF2_VIBCL|nr:Uncharacterised protein [Vibrio cholerae]CSB91697.1 Uncharacterised protein [Vibrio cholerae]
MVCMLLTKVLKLLASCPTSSSLRGSKRCVKSASPEAISSSAFDTRPKSRNKKLTSQETITTTITVISNAVVIRPVNNSE